MLMNILVGLLTMTVCLFFETLLLLVALRYYVRREARLHAVSFWPSIWVLGGVMAILALGNFIQVGVWALLFQILGEFKDYYTSFYHSAVNFATLGYGDIVMSERHRLLGPIQAINGVLMIGVSTAVLMAAFQDALKKTISVRQGRLADGETKSSDKEGYLG